MNLQIPWGSKILLNSLSQHFQEKGFFVCLVPDDSVYALRVKNFMVFALSCTISEINRFSSLTKNFNFKMATENGGEMNF